MGRGYAMGLAAHVVAASPVPARSQMAASLGFHIILACFGTAMSTSAPPSRRWTRSWPGFRPIPGSSDGTACPRNRRPPLPTLIHLSFDLMVGLGFLLLALAAWQG